jgi:hypothetical protein
MALLARADTAVREADQPGATPCQCRAACHAGRSHAPRVEASATNTMRDPKSKDQQSSE